MFIGKVLTSTSDPNTHQIVVEFGVYKDDGENVIEIRKLGFDEVRSADEIKNDLDSFMVAYNRDYEQSLVQTVVDDNVEKIDNTIEEIEGYVTVLEENE